MMGYDRHAQGHHFVLDGYDTLANRTRRRRYVCRNCRVLIFPDLEPEPWNSCEDELVELADSVLKE